MCGLNGETVAGGTIDICINGESIDIIIKGSSFSTSQIAACSGSCNGGSQVTCTDDNGKGYTGTCQKICCLPAGSTCCLTSCCGG